MTRQPRPDQLAHAILRLGEPFQPKTVAIALRVERADLVRWARWRYRQQRRRDAL